MLRGRVFPLSLNFTATKANPKCQSRYEIWYGRTPPSPFCFLKPRFVKRKRTNKLEPQAVPSFYVGSSPNRPCDSMRLIFSSGTIRDSRDVPRASIPPFASVLCGQRGQEPTEQRPSHISPGLGPTQHAKREDPEKAYGKVFGLQARDPVRQ